MICWPFLLFCVHSNSVRTTDDYSWSQMKHLGATVFKREDLEMIFHVVGQTDKWVNMPAKLQKRCTTGEFFYLSSIQNIKQEKMKGIFSQISLRLIGDESTSAGDCQYSFIFPPFPYNAWLLICGKRRTPHLNSTVIG